MFTCFYLDSASRSEEDLGGGEPADQQLPAEKADQQPVESADSGDQSRTDDDKSSTIDELLPSGGEESVSDRVEQVRCSIRGT